MQRLILYFVHFFERAVDALVAARMRRQTDVTAAAPRTRRLPYGRVVLSLVLVGAVAATAVSMVRVLHRKQPAVTRPLPEGLPAGAALVEGGRLQHICTGLESPTTIAKRYYDFSRVFFRDELARRIADENRNSFSGDRCQKGAHVSIPDAELGPIRNLPLGWPAERPVYAVYLRGENTRPTPLAREVARLKAIGANSVVFDVKDIIGVVNYRSSVADVEKYRLHEPPIANLPKTIRYLHENGFYVIARTALFQDETLARRRPDLAIKNAGAPGGILLVKGKPLWVDPGQPEVRRYNLEIVRELVELGVDEIQFDYVRYPAEGDLSRVSYHGISDMAQKTDNLAGFLSGAWLMTRFTGVKTSIDIFGIVAWDEEIDRKNTGQRLERMAPFVDIMSPMLYPSHFNRGFDGMANPADEGYHFYQTGVQRVSGKSARPGLVIRPWIQAFKWRVTNYNEQYIRDQISGSHAAGGIGWLMWNAGNDYDVVYRALQNRRLEDGAAPR